jgi:hypothetical protein
LSTKDVFAALAAAGPLAKKKKAKPKYELLHELEPLPTEQGKRLLLKALDQLDLDELWRVLEESRATEEKTETGQQPRKLPRKKK